MKAPSARTLIEIDQGQPILGYAVNGVPTTGQDFRQDYPVLYIQYPVAMVIGDHGSWSEQPAPGSGGTNNLSSPWKFGDLAVMDAATPGWTKVFFRNRLCLSLGLPPKASCDDTTTAIHARYGSFNQDVWHELKVVQPGWSTPQWRIALKTLYLSIHQPVMNKLQPLVLPTNLSQFATMMFRGATRGPSPGLCKNGTPKVGKPLTTTLGSMSVLHTVIAAKQLGLTREQAWAFYHETGSPHAYTRAQGGNGSPVTLNVKQRWANYDKLFRELW